MSFAVSPSYGGSKDRLVALVRESAADLALVGLFTAVALALRLSQLHTTLIGDEVFTYQDIFGHNLSSVLTTIHSGGENSPPLFFLLAWASAKLGDPTIWIRLPSLVFGVATVPVLYLLGRETVGRSAGLLGAAMMALSPYAIFYGSEARPYATMTFFVALSTLTLVLAVRTRERRWWLAYVVAAVAAAYSHYTSIFLLGVQAAWCFWACRDRLREPLLAHALMLLAYLPWLPHVRGKQLGVIGQLYPLTVRHVLTDPLRPILGHPWATFRAIPTWLGLVVAGVCIGAGLVALVVQWRGSPRRRPGPPGRLALLVALALATPVGLLLYSLTVTDLWLPRGLSASQPATLLVVGALIAALPRRLALAAAAVLLITLSTGALRSTGAAYNRGPYRRIANYVDRVAAPQDAVTIVSLPGVLPISVQLHNPHRVVDAAMWKSVPAGGRAFMILDDTLAQRLNIHTPNEPGFRFVSRRHFAGSNPTDVLTYQRS